jgi:hypothetical protein
LFLVAVFKVNEENSRIRIHLSEAWTLGSADPDPHRNTVVKIRNYFLFAFETKHAELRAQILYKLEQYGDCYAVYRSIVKSTSDEYETERRTNLSAVAAQLADRANVETEDLDTYELRSGNLIFGYF